MKLTTSGMEHTPSTTMVFQTNEYNKFNMIKGNRDLDMNKIKRILADIDRGINLLKFVPIVVVEKNKKLDIVDGQHRFMVAKKIKHAVHYIIAEDISLYDIARMNSNTEKWKAKDFINCYIQLGNDNYRKLDQFMKTYKGVPVTTAVSLLALGKVHGGSNSSTMESFHRGQFVAAKIKEADSICKTIDLVSFDEKFSRTFMQAMAKVMEADVFPVEELIKKVNSEPAQLQKHDHWRKYLTNLEEIASKGKHKRVAIY
jgi:ParB-like chromosome segregation protein Spo0J